MNLVIVYGIVYAQWVLQAVTAMTLGTSGCSTDCLISRRLTIGQATHSDNTLWPVQF